MEKISEVDFINKLAENFRRSPQQKNKIHESDAEIISLGKGLEKVLAITTDTICEEIKYGLYDDPFLIGWMTVMVNMSDLAAVGAAPIGILISEAFPHSPEENFIAKIQKGIETACSICNTFVVGGDITSSDQLSLTGTAIGLLDENKYLSRVGCKPGDLIYSTGKLGLGNAFALQKIKGFGNDSIRYKPVAKLTEGNNLLGFTNCCMDTSDGAISTFDQIMNLNNCGIELVDEWEKFIDEKSIELCKKLKTPIWFLLAGYHGEFELIFCVDPNSEFKLLEQSKKNNWQPIKIGKVIEEPSLFINLYGQTKNIDSSFIRNLSFQYSCDVKAYINSLLEYDEKLRKN